MKRSQIRAVAQWNQIATAIRVCLLWESHFFSTAISVYETKRGLVRQAFRSYRERLRLTLPIPATA
jgi:hypothetical protein